MRTMNIGGHTVGTYCGPHSIRHIVPETCHACGARPGQACRRLGKTPPVAQRRIHPAAWRIASPGLAFVLVAILLTLAVLL